MNLSLKDRALLIKLFYTNDSSLIVALRLFRTEKKLRKKGPISAKALKAMILKFENTGSLGVAPGRGRKPVKSDDVENVATSIVESSAENVAGTSSARRVAQILELPYSTVWKILRKMISFYPYKISHAHQLLNSDFEKRVTFATTFLEKMGNDKENSIWPWNIMWSDEAHFYLNGQVNTQNCRIWSSEQPSAVHLSPLHSPKVTVWCGFTSKVIVGPYFFEVITPTGPQSCTVNGARYKTLITDFLTPQLIAKQCMDSVIFMQDGAPAHTTKAVRAVLKDTFTNARVISLHFPLQWPPRSPDLTPCDFWLWGYLKSQVYIGGVSSLQELKANIEEAIHNIPTAMLHSAVENTVHRMQCILHANGRHIEHNPVVAYRKRQK